MKRLTQHTLARRLLCIPPYFFLAGLMLLTLPVWLVLSWLAGRLFKGARSAPRCLSFITVYLLCECAGVIGSAALWLWFVTLGRDRSRYLSANQRLQFWWAEALRGAAQTLFRLRFEVEGVEALQGAGAIVLPRHTSIGDTIFPVSFYARPRGLRVSYVLKRELLLDPCLDIVGNRLPNVFLDRVADDMSSELAAIATLAANARDEDALVIYMEGTRFSTTKRERIIASMRQQSNPDMVKRAEQWEKLLPPRMAGALALMDAAPHKDLLFCAHTGFEGSANFATLFNGGWLDTTVRIRFWRVAAADIPADRAGRRELLLSHWDRMHGAVDTLMQKAA